MDNQPISISNKSCLTEIDASSKHSLLGLLVKEENYFEDEFRGAHLKIANWSIDDANTVLEIIFQSKNSLLIEADIKECIEFFSANFVSINFIVPISHAALVTFLSNCGFELHHTEGNEIFLCLWLDKTRPNKIPNQAYTHVGIGSVILTKNFEFLLVKERIKKGRKNLWKFVTGLVDYPETIYEASFREVFEEIGIPQEALTTVGNILARWVKTSPHLVDCCFFNLFVLNEDYTQKKVEQNIDFHEISEVKFFTFQEAQELATTDDLTIATKMVLTSLLPNLVISNDFDSNISRIKQTSCNNSLSECYGLKGFMLAFTPLITN